MAKFKLFHKALGLQSSPLTGLQKAFAEPEGNWDGGKAFEAIVVIDETIAKSEAGHEFTVFANKGDLREALMEAIQRNDPQVRYLDAALIDTGRIRKSVAEHLFPGHTWARDDDGAVNQDGIPLVKSADKARLKKALASDVVVEAYNVYAETPGATDLKAAARELDALVERMKNG